MTLDELVAAGTTRLGASDAGELLTLQLAAWVREGRDNNTISIPALLEELPDVQAQLNDPAQTIWGYRDGPRLIATVRTSLVGPPVEPLTAHLGRLGVVPDRFRQGLGGAMLRLAEERLSPAVRRIELVTGLLSLGNHVFYDRHGYVRYGVDEARGIVLMAKDL